MLLTIYQKKTCIPNAMKDVNLNIFNMRSELNESKTVIKLSYVI